MSAFDDLLEEEYERMNRMLRAMESELRELPRGYLSRKSIGGRSYSYLQERRGKKVVSVYVREEDVPEMLKKIERRRSLSSSIRECRKNICRIERIIKNGKAKV